MSGKSIAKICGVGGPVLLLLFAALGPGNWQLRSGLGWQFDHVAGYFAFTVLFALAWRRPPLVGGILIAAGMLLEALQALTPDRHCDFQGALYSVAGALAGALFADLCFRIWDRRAGRAALASRNWVGAR